MKAKAVKRAAFFDLERTITRHAVEREIYLMMYRRGRIPLSGAVKTVWGYAKYGMGILHDLEAMRRQAAAAHGGYDAAETINIYIEPYAEYLGVADFYGVRLEERDGLFTGKISGMIVHQRNKALLIADIAAREGIDLSGSYAFGDSINDRYMLEAVGNPCAVNPDGKLRKLALAKGWTVLRWNTLNG